MTGTQAGEAKTPAALPLDGGAPSGTPSPRRGSGDLIQRITRGNPLVVALSFVFAFLIGSVLIIVADTDVQEALGYFFARPADTLVAAWAAISEAYSAMFRGAVFDVAGFRETAEDIRARGGSGLYVLLPAFAEGIDPFLETLTVATPLIIASVGMAVSFRSGLFNIGGTGQLIVGASAAAFIGFSVPMPPVIHLIACILAAIIAGGLYGGIAGFLKARFGASEVITTIMLNWIAFNGLAFALTTAAFTGANQAQPTSPAVAVTSRLPLLAGDQFRLHAGLLLSIASIVFLWWLMSRSTIGFRFRAVGSNPRAAEVAGIDVGRSAVGVMLVAGGLVGLAGGVHVLGTEHRLTGSIDGNIGFDAITVALLGRSGPIGILLAGILYAALSTGGRFMESSQGVPIDLVHVIQALVVLFIAAPPLVRQLVGLRSIDRPGAPRRRKTTSPSAPSAPDGTETPARTAATTDIGGTSSAGPDTSAPDPRTSAPPAAGAPPQRSSSASPDADETKGSDS